jgi:hypothetical protein
MDTSPKAHIPVGIHSILLSMGENEIVIENPDKIPLLDNTLNQISDAILGWFCDGALCQTAIINDFTESMLTMMPAEGGIIPLENILEWVELNEDAKSVFLALKHTITVANTHLLAVQT